MALGKVLARSGPTGRKPNQNVDRNSQGRDVCDQLDQAGPNGSLRPRPGVIQGTGLDDCWRLEDADKQEKDKSQNDDAYEDQSPRLTPGLKVTVAFAPIPQVWVIWVRRYRTYWSWHRPSVGKAVGGSRTRKRIL